MEEVTAERRAAAWLLLAIACFLLSVWKGEPHRGYGDMREYFENTESIWLQGELCYYPNPAAPGGKEYHRYPMGLPVLAGPFLFAGLGLERVTSGVIAHRTVVAAMIPLLALCACALVLDLGRRMGVALVPRLWCALMLAIGTQVLTYSRLYYTEIVILFFIILALDAFVRARGKDATAPLRWWLVAGASLAGVTACHYGDVALSAALWLVFALSLWRDRAVPVARRWLALGALSAVPMLAGFGVLAVNRAHFGSPFSTGYHFYYRSLYGIGHLAVNAPFFGLWLLRSAWLPVGLLCLPALWRRERALAYAVAAGLAGQALLWACFADFHRFNFRYPMPLLGLGVPLLLLGAAQLHEHFSRRGLAYAGVTLCTWNVLWFVHGEDIWPSFFTLPGEPGVVRCHVWYMQALERSRDIVWGSPIGPVQAAVFLLLLIAGGICTALAFRSARSDPARQAK